MHDTQDTAHIPVKLYRGPDRLVIAAPMAGMEPEDILVKVDGNGRLGLHALERAALKGDKEVLLDEWNPGPYHRQIDLPNAVDAELATVTYRNGVLVVALPLADRTRPAQIALTTLGPGHGEWIGSHGHPVRPTTAAAHHAGGEQRGTPDPHTS